jgi:Trk K+ transport system NAD-binding subunit
MPAPSAHLSPGNHLIVCGDTPLAYRLIRELTHRYHESVVVIIPGRLQNHGPRIAAISGITVLERAELTSAALREAGVATARAAAMVGWDDLANFHAALRAQELNPDLRIVVGADNRRLGDHITGLLRDCTVLSSSQLAGPALVAAALGEIAPSHVRVTGQTLYVAGRGDVPSDHVLCGLAVTDDPGVAAQLVAPDDVHDDADLVLAVADGTPRNPLTRPRRRPLRAVADLPRLLFGYKLGLVFLVLFGVLVAGFVLLATAGGYSPANALYLTFLDAAGAAYTNSHLSAPEKFAQFMLTFDGMAFLPVVTAAVVGARLTGSVRGKARPLSGHVIVAGLGNVGTRIAGQLHDLGVDVVCVDRDENAAGIRLARQLGLRVVIGETTREETLRSADVRTSQALVSVTNSDIVNLETALHARALAADVRLVLRLSDDDLAERVQKTVGNAISRSVPYLAAPAFAAAMLEHQVLRTIPVGRHVLLIADVRVEAGSELAGQAVEDVNRGGAVRVIAVGPATGGAVDWSPRPGYLIAPQDRIYVLATRTGLSGVLARSQSGGAVTPA